MIAIVGGGIVGLATAYALRRFEPVVFEKEAAVARHQTGRNSGVLHTGVYYKPGSRKAELCVEGRRLMVEFCREHGIAHALCGKVIVATEGVEIPRLDELERRARANGVRVERVGPERLREIEPRAAGVDALHLPDAGIVDYAEVARKLAAFVEVRTGVEVRDVRALRATLVINCAGLYSDRVARSRTRIMPFRGEYYYLRRPELVRGLIYPAPDPEFPFLDVHFTRKIHGGVEAGPNAVLAFAREGYRWR
ncbi:MAG TPA: L-2-hydroxyglutarate oxidase, partial [Planctomycetota bacterium]|nr:L-2-hydroxyglutarate oxidase [Planctomycetota bacterium]